MNLMMTLSRTWIQVHPRDNVAVALDDLPAGSEFGGVILQEDIMRGHKFALMAIPAGEVVTKYGASIGIASIEIPAGGWVHTHNLRTGLTQSGGWEWSGESFSGYEKAAGSATFRGYRRANGSVAIRNEIWVINTVACVNQTARQLADQADRRWAGKGIDGVFTFPHPFGCSQLGDDLGLTRKALAGLISHPNAGAVLVIGLGCENNQIREQIEQAGGEAARVKWFNTQEVGDEYQRGAELIDELVELIRNDERVEIPASELILGMKCGGSDGLSGITANPLVGMIADRHCAAGGTTLLTEVPEMFGAEEELLRRTTGRDAFDAVVGLIENFKAYFVANDQPVYENPSPGNKEGGITTLEEKSLGCIQKGGQAPVVMTLDYGQRAPQGLGGLALVNSPGNDGVSSTAMTVAGAHMVLFTTGRGNPLGVPVPTIKIASNSPLASRKPGWIDFDAGRMIEEGASAETIADELFDLVLRIASGEVKAKNEEHGYREIAIWKQGVTL